VNEKISLTIPRERQFHSVAHLVLGGLAVRHNLTMDSLEDLQVAFDQLLDADEEPSDVTVDLSVGASAIEAEIGPLQEKTVKAATAAVDGFDLARVLSTVVDRVEPSREGWLRLTKEIGG